MSWTLTGTVFVRGRSKVHVQFQSGALAFALLEAGTTGTVNVRNPWSGVSQPPSSGSIRVPSGFHESPIPSQ